MVPAGTRQNLGRHAVAELTAGPRWLRGEVDHHLRHVLRARPGDRLVLFDGSGREATARVVEVGSDGVEVDVAPPVDVSRESPVAVALAFALSKGDKPEWICQKAVELGAAELIVVAAEHSVVRWRDDQVDHKLERLSATVRGACAQSGRTIYPPVSYAASVAGLCDRIGDQTARVVVDPSGETSLSDVAARADPARLVVAAGPEGGWSTGELDAFRAAGWSVAHLGPRILRAETATLAALAAIQARVGDLG